MKGRKRRRKMTGKRRSMLGIWRESRKGIGLEKEYPVDDRN